MPSGISLLQEIENLLGKEELLHIGHNVLKAHGKAVRVLREKIPGVKIGLVTASAPACPVSEKDDISSLINIESDKVNWRTDQSHILIRYFRQDTGALVQDIVGICLRRAFRRQGKKRDDL